MTIRRHKHLDGLLATFHHQRQYHLIFRWADGGNLMDLWQTHMKQPKIEHGLVCWLAEQCHGLACGLEEIHRSSLSQEDIEDILESNSPTSSSSKPAPRIKHYTVNPTKASGGQDYGRHGDIKPQNILWFRHDANQYGHGVLRISNCGLITFESTFRIHFQRGWPGATWTYGKHKFSLV